VIARLAEAQPALAALAEDPSLRGLLGELELGVEEIGKGEPPPAGFLRMAERVAEITETLLAGRPKQVSWSDELMPDEGTVYRLIHLQGLPDFTTRVSSGALMDEIRATAEGLGLTPERGVRVRLTGMVPLATEEMVSVQESLVLAGAVSLTLLALILGYGVRSLRIILATLLTLATSLAWTAAYAMATVGEFNTISAAFAVLLIGLGVDFAIHIGLRFQEETQRGVAVPEALQRSAEGVGGAVSLCALTSGIGFAAFIPTEYRGLAELGVIAAGGMFLSLVASFSVFPAALAVAGRPTPRPAHRELSATRLYPLLLRRSGAIVAVTAALAVVAVVLTLSRTTFDFSTLGMKDPRSESMTTLRELQREGIVTDYSITALAPDLASSGALAAALEALPVVSETRPPAYYVPKNQDEKLDVLFNASFFLEPVLNPPPALPAPTAEERRATLRDVRAEIDALPDVGVDPEAAAVLARLDRALGALLARADPDRLSRALEQLLVSDLEERIDWLRRALGVGPVAFEDLPADLRERLVAPDGRTRVVALPAEDVSETAALARFIEGVTTVAPRATGRPVVEAGVGAIVVRSFHLAVGIATVAIGAVLLVTLRSGVDALLVLMPIAVAAFFTCAFGVLSGTPFNMSNVVAIPLILGLGVDSGIHVFMRMRREGSLEDTMDSTTPRAVLLSALTTLAAFGSLTLSSHRGISSMGLLLSVSVIFVIYTTVVALPALLLVLGRIPAASRTGERNA
jgi:hopanoid biosynthesis associated RND transporter like protein HpnN